MMQTIRSSRSEAHNYSFIVVFGCSVFHLRFRYSAAFLSLTFNGLFASLVNAEFVPKGQATRIRLPILMGEKGLITAVAKRGLCGSRGGEITMGLDAAEAEKVLAGYGKRVEWRELRNLAVSRSQCLLLIVESRCVCWYFILFPLVQSSNKQLLIGDDIRRLVSRFFVGQAVVTLRSRTGDFIFFHRRDRLVRGRSANITGDISQRRNSEGRDRQLVFTPWRQLKWWSIFPSWQFHSIARWPHCTHEYSIISTCPNPYVNLLCHT